ncbi:MAG: TRAP transporter large permease, partial [Paracoccaceae bacterium]|nr:TRAP transporter large permease [Paracoccaceae bacterium]
LMVAIYVRARMIGLQGAPRAPLGEVLKAGRDSLWGLLLIVIILGGIYGGVFTPTEAAAVAVVYALFLGLVVYKEMTLRDLPELFKSAAISSGAVMLIIAAASLFSFLISLSGMPNAVGAWAQNTFTHAWTFLLAVNALLFFIGMFIETSAAILVLAPILTPVAMAFGIDPVHFGIVIVVNLALGMFTPPLGVNLFAAAQVANIPVQKMFRTLVIPVLTMITTLMIITYVPQISLFLRDVMQ